MESTHEIIEAINKSTIIDFEFSFNITKRVSRLLRDPKTEESANKIIIHILDSWDKLDEKTKEIWIDLIEAAGFYPYLIKKDLKSSNTAMSIRKEYFKSKNINGTYFHEEQKILLNKLMQGKNLIVSAPTSFGKSLLIEEIIAGKVYRNIVIIQPTLALLDETRKKLNKYRESYKIIVRTSQRASEDKRNIFLLTAERVMEYKEMPQIDMAIIDEFYKLSARRDDERSDVLNNAFNLLINKHKAKFYLLGPNIDGISDGFAKKYDAEFYKTNFSLVENNTIDYFTPYKGKFGVRNEKKLFKEKVLFELLYKLKGEQTIIYCSSPLRVRYLSNAYCKYLTENNMLFEDIDVPLIEWIQKNITNKWRVIDCLKQGIGIHDGALQKHMTSSMIDYFNEGKLKYLFCTSTIIEGVNTSAKNVIFFDATKGMRKNIDYFDYSNIKGRSGRLMVHYIGKIYNFNEPPKKENVIIDIPFFEQNPVSNEVLIHIPKESVIDVTSEQYKKIEEIPVNEKVLFKKNGVLVEGQQAILKKLRQDIHSKRSQIIWNRYPTYQQLGYVLELGWNNLIRQGESVRPMTLKKLNKVTFDYGIDKSINKMISSNYSYLKGLSENERFSDEELIDKAIRESLQIVKHWIHYKVPKWLNVVHNLQSFVCNEIDLEAGDYSFYASNIENDFIRNELIILMEYGIPESAIRKLSSHIPQGLQDDSIIKYIKQNNLDLRKELIQYEKEKIRQNL